MPLSQIAARPLKLTLPVPDQIPAGVGQANAVATIEHPPALHSDRDGVFRHVIEIGRQYPPAGFAICRVVQCPYQETGGPFALVDHALTTAAGLKGLPTAAPGAIAPSVVRRC